MLYNRRTRILFWLLALLILFVMIELPILYDRGTLTHTSTLKEVQILTEDGYIQIQWKKINAWNLKSIQIDITDDKNEVVLSQQLPPNATSFQFSQGLHGNAYTVSISMTLKNHIRTDALQKRVMFLNYSQLPNIPFLNIETQGNVMPSHKPINPPEGCGGIGITDNNYIMANISFTEEDSTHVYSGAQIRIRGNTSAGAIRKPYKLFLQSPEDLLKDGNSAHQEWLLLPFNNLNFVVGTAIALECGMEWQPRFRLVNLMIAGDYLGSYLLTESVCESENRFDLTETGYLFELDAYWWNSGGMYFKINGQSKSSGYTFKYPDETTLSAQKMESIRIYMDKLFQYLRAGDPEYTKYIDVQNWADWLLIQDIRGSWDFAGTNLYYNKYDFNISDPTATKLKMGPIWDFDSLYVMQDQWANVREYDDSGFPYLLTQPEFILAYQQRWESISDSLSENVTDYAIQWTDFYGEALNKSLYLDSIRWKTQIRNINSELETAENWFVSRTIWINEQLNQ